MDKMYKRLIIITTIFLVSVQGITKTSNKQGELIQLKFKLIDARQRIRNSSESRSYDYLKLLPDISISRKNPGINFDQAESYIGVSFSINKAFDITDKIRERKANKKKALRRVQSLGYKITKYIDQKYLHISRRWKYQQIKRSTKNPVDIAKLDEKTDELNIKINSISIEIEDVYANIEFVCVDVER